MHHHNFLGAVLVFSSVVYKQMFVDEDEGMVE